MANRLNQMLTIIGITGALAVALGAFGSHGLAEALEASRLQIWKTGVQYHFYHLLLMALAMYQYRNTSSKAALWSFRLSGIGILLFSGSLYLLATRDLLGISSWTWLGPLTPLGGLCLMSGWLSLGLCRYRS